MAQHIEQKQVAIQKLLNHTNIEG